MSDNVTLSRNQRRALTALLSSRSVLEAAEACGLSDRQLYRYLEDPGFRAALTDLEADMIDTAGRRLLTGQEAALDALQDIIENSRRDGDRRQAAVAWLDLCLRWRELRDVEERLKALEERVYGQER